MAKHCEAVTGYVTTTIWPMKLLSSPQPNTDRPNSVLFFRYDTFNLLRRCKSSRSESNFHKNAAHPIYMPPYMEKIRKPCQYSFYVRRKLEGRTKFFGSVASLNNVSTVISTDETVSPGGPYVVDCVPFNLWEIVCNAPLASDFLCSSSRRAFCSLPSFRPEPIALRCWWNKVLA